MKCRRLIRINNITRILLLAGAAAEIAILPQISHAALRGPCSTDSQSHQLDFWLGQWSIAGPGSSLNATSTVTTTLDGCIVVEAWDGGRGHTGKNWFGYSADDKSWHGMFADNQGRVHVFVDGKVTNGAAEFTGPSHGANGEAFLNRVRIVRVGPDKVEQIWEKSSDDGARWATEFRGEYLRKKS